MRAKSFFFASFFIACIINLLFCEESSGETPTVVALTKDTFDKFIKEHPFTVVEFFAPWCGHCKRLAPEYEAAAKVLKEDGIMLASVDATAETELASKFEISGYPTLKVFRNGHPEEYKGGRTRDTIIQWVRRMTGAAIKDVDSAEAAKKEIQNTPISFVGSFKSKDSPAYKDFTKIAEEFRTIGKFVAIISDKGDNTITAHREEEGATSPQKYQDYEKLKKFVDYERFPLFGAISGTNYADYFQNKRDLVWFIGTADQYKSAGKAIRQIAAVFRDKFSFVWLDGNEYKDHAESALGVSELPALVLQRPEGRFVYPQRIFDSPEPIKVFLQNALDGKLEKHLISEEIPEKSSEPVQVVVGKTFMELTFQPKKDVFLEVYAPWCGHCKQFEPIYKEFAESMKQHDHVFVAKMDGTKNESPTPKIQWAGFPTIYFIKAGKDEAVVYEGARTVAGLTEYLKEHGSKPLDTETTKEQKDEL